MRDDVTHASVRALGWELERERVHRGIERGELARRARVVPSQLVALELGLGGVRLDTVYAVVKALELEVTITTGGFQLRPAAPVAS
jgi:predicted transcriptional regulator